MLFKSQSTAKLLLAVLVVTASTSAYFANEWHSQKVGAKGSLASATRAESEAKKAHNELASILSPDVGDVSIQDSMSKLMLDVYNRRLPHGITVASVTPGKFAASGSMSPLDALIEEVPGTKVQSMRVNLRGTYSNYLGLLAYVKDLQANPVSVVHMKVQDQGFELGLRVYGNAGN